VVTYVSTSLFFLYLPFWNINRRCNKIKGHPWENGGIWSRYLGLGGVRTSEDTDDMASEPLNEIDISTPLFRKSESDVRMTHDEIIHISFVLAIVWFGSNLMYSYSLLWTTIASSTIISNLSSIFTLFFSYFAGLEEVNVFKLVGVALCFTGVVLVTVQDSTSGDDDDGGTKQSVVGDLMALGSAVGYGAYTTYLRYHVPTEEVVCMELILGYMGLVCLVLAAPLLLAVIYLEVDNLANFTGLILFYLMCTGLFDYVVSDYLWARAIILTTPTVATVGLSITIPLAFLGDILLNGYSRITTFAVIGSVLVMSGFALVNAYGGGGSPSDDEVGSQSEVRASRSDDSFTTERNKLSDHF